MKRIKLIDLEKEINNSEQTEIMQKNRKNNHKKFKILERKHITKQNGITLLALVITIIVLLILAEITIGTITGDNGILKNALSAKERTEIAEEIEIVEEATIRAMGNNRRGNIVKNELQEELDKITGEEKTIVTTDTEEQGHFVKFVESGRIYKVSIDGDVEYLGIENELITQAEIIANPESNTTPEFIQQVELTVKTPIEIEGAEYSLLYAWNQDKEHAPEDSKFLGTTLKGEGRIRTTTVYSSDTVGGDYYLWVRIVVGEIEREACFGPYTIRDRTSLVATSNEIESTSGFLGSANQENETVKGIQRGLIESVNITTSLVGHSKNDANTWDVSQKQDGMYLAWYEDNDSDGYYEITIAGDGDVVANSNSSYLFANIGYGVKNQEVTITGLENLETELTTDMSYMFRECKVQEINVNTLDTSNVTTLDNTFSNCSNLETLDLNNWNTSKVENLFSTFQGCTNLKTLEVGDWNTSNVTIMGEEGMNFASYGTFQGCSNLTTLDLSKWDTSNVTAMGNTFSQCSSLINLDLSNFDTSKVYNMFNMFKDCSKLQNLKIEQLKTNSVSIMAGMFQNCSGLTELDLSSFNTSNVTIMNSMFNNCSSLTKLDLSNFNTSKVTGMSYMFYGCNSLTELNFNNFNTSKVTTMSYMFRGCNSLTELNVGNFNTSNVTMMESMFNSCSNLSKLDLSSFNTSNVTTMANMFNACSNITELDLSSFDTSNVTSMNSMFNNCSSLTKLDLSNFNTYKVKNMWHLLWGCSNLMELDISNFNTQNVTNWEGMFSYVPTTVKITTNQSTKNWILDQFPTYTNITTVVE